MVLREEVVASKLDRQSTTLMIVLVTIIF
jgi:hypothetical protein